MDQRLFAPDIARARRAAAAPTTRERLEGRLCAKLAYYL